MGIMSAVVAEAVVEAEIEVEAEGQAGSAAEATAAPRKRGGGPRSPEGRARCAKNALRAGFRAQIHLHEEEQEAATRHIAAMTAKYAPADEQEAWWVKKMAFAAARLDRCHEQIPFDIGRARLRAAENWDDDRTEHVDRLAARIGREPRRVVRALVKSLHGVRYLRDSLELIRNVLAAGGGMNEARRSLALDLIGIDHALREDNPSLLEASETEAWGLWLAQEIADLTEREKQLEPSDERDQQLAMMGMTIEEDAVTRRLRRAESESKRDLKRALDELLRLQGLRGCFGNGSGNANEGTSPSTATTAMATPGPAEPPELPARPVVSPQAETYLVRRAIHHPALTLVQQDDEPGTPDGPGPRAQAPSQAQNPAAPAAPAVAEATAAPAPVPVTAAASPEPVRQADARPRDQAQYTRHDRRRRRMLEKLAKEEERRKGW
jgi:hypothetical protein